MDLRFGMMILEVRGEVREVFVGDISRLGCFGLGYSRLVGRYFFWRL